MRISDVGVSKEASEITGTVTGSFLYMAPECSIPTLMTSNQTSTVLE